MSLHAALPVYFISVDDTPSRKGGKFLNKV